MSERLSTMIRYSCSTFDLYIHVWVINTCKTDMQTSTIINFILCIFCYEYKSFNVSDQSAQSIYCTGCIVEPVRFFSLPEPLIRKILHCLRWWCALLPREASSVTVSDTLHNFDEQKALQSRLSPPRSLLRFYHESTVATVPSTGAKVSCLSCFSATMRSSRWQHDTYLLHILK